MKLNRTLVIWLVLILTPSCVFGKDYQVRLEPSIMIPMRDGVKLSTDLYFPAEAKGQLPAVLLRTVYGKNKTFGWSGVYQLLVEQGYVVVIQDVRGRYESEGSYVVAEHRREDSYDTVDWLISQGWSNQKVGSAGCSYLGETQVILAAAKHPNHVAAVPMSAASGFYMPGRAWQSFSGGVFELAQTAGWFAASGSQLFYGPPAHIDRGQWFKTPQSRLFKMAPEVDFAAYLELLSSLPTHSLLERAQLPPSEYKSWITSAPDGKFFRNKDLAKRSDTFNVPSLFMDSWYDYGPAETIEMFKTFQRNAQSEQARNNQFLIIGPGTHCDYTESTDDAIVGARNLGDASLNYSALQLQWYDYWLKGKENAITEMPHIQYYVMGKNQWRNSEVWPLASTNYQKWYLAGKGKAQSRTGDGLLSLNLPDNDSRDSYVYDPADPVPSLGGHTCCTGSDTEAGGYDQSEIELRQDVLVYTSPELIHGFEVTGELKAVLYVSSSALDTDFTVKLVDVYPTGEAYNIQEGAIRMRYRNSLSDSQLIEPGKIYQVEVALNVTSNYFAAGHKLRVEISSSNFPRWERNLNTGGNNYDETNWKTAQNTIYHSANYPSHLVLPVIIESP